MSWADWDLQWPTGTGLAVAGALVAAQLALAIWHWRRGAGGWRQFVLAGLRVVVIVLIVVTLFKPERLQRETLTRNPQVVVLRDDTGSMATVDAGADTATALTRQAWLDQQWERQFWAPLSPRYEVHQEKLSAYAQPPDDPQAAPGTNLNGALLAISDRYPQLRAVLVLSDGDWNLGGSPLGAATQLRLRQARIFAVAVGRDQFRPDLVLDEARLPAFCLQGERVVVPLRLVSHLTRDVRTKVRLLSSLGGGTEKEIVLPAGQQVQENLLWTAERLGEQTVTVEVPVEPDECAAENNKREFRVAVRQEQLKVLVIESWPRWEYRYLRNALARDPGADVSCLLLHPGLAPGGGEHYLAKLPGTRDEISKYDVIFLGDVGLGPNELSREELELIRGVVEQQGTGLVFLPGQRGRQATWPDSPLGEALPVILDETKPKGLPGRGEAKLALTALGTDHLLTMLAGSADANRLLWQNLPGFYWCAGVTRAKSGTDVLAVHDTLRNRWGRVPLLVTRSFGNGNVLFMGTDSAWRWRRGVEDTYHYRFWGQVIRWMAHPRHLARDQGLRLFFSPENPRQGETVFLQATAFDRHGFPLAKGTVTATIAGPEQASEQLTFSPVPGGWGVFTASFAPRRAGPYEIAVACAETGARLRTGLQVGRLTLETVGQPARFGALQDLARLTNGGFGRAADLDRLVTRVNLLPQDEALVRRLPLWSRWWWGLIVVGLFGLYWSLRKKWGLI